MLSWLLLVPSADSHVGLVLQVDGRNEEKPLKPVFRMIEVGTAANAAGICVERSMACQHAGGYKF